MESPPPEAYGRVTNPERFAPVVESGRRAMSDLAEAYDVAVRTDRGPGEVFRSVKSDCWLDMIVLQPRAVDAAPLAMAFSLFPGVCLHAGLGVQVPFPSCGCDACDENAADEIARLDEILSAIISGQFYEALEIKDGQRWHCHQWSRKSNWSSSGRTLLNSAEITRLSQSSVVLPPDGQWRPWRTRESVAGELLPPDWRCMDCGMNTIYEYFTLHDELWRQANPQIDGKLCVGCVEERLGRRLTAADFRDLPINTSSTLKRSARLRDRLSRESR